MNIQKAFKALSRGSRIKRKHWDNTCLCLWNNGIGQSFITSKDGWVWSWGLTIEDILTNDWQVIK